MKYNSDVQTSYLFIYFFFGLLDVYEIIAVVNVQANRSVQTAATVQCPEHLHFAVRVRGLDGNVGHVSRVHGVNCIFGANDATV